MKFDEMREAINDARATINRADMVVSGMASMCAGRLRSAGVSHHYLCELKKELANYNMHTGSWKS